MLLSKLKMAAKKLEENKEALRSKFTKCPVCSTQWDDETSDIGYDIDDEVFLIACNFCLCIFEVQGDELVICDEWTENNGIH